MAELQAAQRRADAEPTAFLWKLYLQDGRSAQPSGGTVQMSLAHDGVIMDQLTDSAITFHIKASSNRITLWSWTRAEGGVAVTSNGQRYQFDLHHRERDTLTWEFRNTTDPQDWGYGMIKRPDFRLFQPRSWELLKKDRKSGNWKHYYAFDTVNGGTVNVSAQAGFLQWKADSGRLLDFRQKTKTFSWNGPRSQGAYKYEFSRPPSDRTVAAPPESGPLTIDQQNLFPNGPIYLNFRDSEGPQEYILLRY